MRSGKLSVVKIGGKLIEEKETLEKLLLDLIHMEGKKILVHGGGNMATELSAKLGYQTRMVDGRRITDADSLQVIVMVYGGLINKTLVSRLQFLGADAVGLCGADGKALVSRKRRVAEIDYGFVGDIEEVNVEFISLLLEQNIIPVFSAISWSKAGELLNTNGDTVAAEVAGALAGRYDTGLYYCLDKNGVLADPSDEASLIPSLDKNSYETLRDQGIISGGMLPKLFNCFGALERGVDRVFLGGSAMLGTNAERTEIRK